MLGLVVRNVGLLVKPCGLHQEATLGGGLDADTYSGLTGSVRSFFAQVEPLNNFNTVY